MRLTLLRWMIAPCLFLAEAAPSCAQKAEFFEARVRPVLVEKCLACHGASGMGGLQLDSRFHLLQGGKDGAAVLPGDPDGSLLIQAVRRTHARFKMPPTGALTDQAVADLSTWVRDGAIWPEAAPVVAASGPGKYVITKEQRSFWAFQPVAKPAVPTVLDRAWPHNEIDRFILARLEQDHLHPVRAAEKAALIRRATFDLIGLPPTPEEVDRFVADSAPDAFARVIDRLLASPHYGEQWGRHWLDLARYSDGDLGASHDTPFPNAFRYRDWVVKAFNNDLPYDRFVKAQIAGDLIVAKRPEELVPGLGFYALGPGDDDRVDVTGQVFLGLTVGCARCHDHKYDPIPTRDFYSLLGVFKSTEAYEYPLAAEAAVTAYRRAKSEVERQRYALEDFVQKQSTQLGEILAAKTSHYLVAAWEVISKNKPDCASAAHANNLDEVTLERWVSYLGSKNRDHGFLKNWDELLATGANRKQVEEAAKATGEFVSAIFEEKHGQDDRNYVKLGGAAGVRDEKKRQYTNLESLPIEKYYFWRDLASEPYKKDFLDFKGGVYYYGAKDLPRFLAPEWRQHLEDLQGRLAQLERELPAQYPFLHTVRDIKNPADIHVYLRGDEKNPGEPAPRHFLSILSSGAPEFFQKGSGRLEMAEAIASSRNPLFARVMVNRIWQEHFGAGLVRTASNFGLMGERPSHPELLDHLAARFVELGWSIKAMHREIMLSATYRLSTDVDEGDSAKDPGNRLLWRANLRQRLTAEELRDALLAVSGKIDLAIGGPPAPLTDTHVRRAIYGLVGRTKPDQIMALFDFPNPNMTSERRMVTVGPLQRLYFMNNGFVALQARTLAKRLESEESTDAARITRAYRLLFSRSPTPVETGMGQDFLLKTGRDWPQYVQVLFSSAEFSSVN